MVLQKLDRRDAEVAEVAEEMRDENGFLCDLCASAVKTLLSC